MRFSHDAGAVPVIGPTGNAVFTIGGQAKRLAIEPGALAIEPSPTRFVRIIVNYN